MKTITTLLTVAVLFLQTPTYRVSWYGGKHHGKATASGEIFDKNKLTTAGSSKYKLGEVLEVTNIDNGKSVIVRVNDRGGFAKYGRELDLSEGAFKAIAPLGKGEIKVNIKRL